MLNLKDNLLYLLVFYFLRVHTHATEISSATVFSLLLTNVVFFATSLYIIEKVCFQCFYLFLELIILFHWFAQSGNTREYRFRCCLHLLHCQRTGVATFLMLRCNFCYNPHLGSWKRGLRQQMVRLFFTGT